MSGRTTDFHTVVAQRRALRKARRAAVMRKDEDGLKRERYTLPREEAREKAREFFRRYPKSAYWSRVESWGETRDGKIAFTLCRLPTAD